MEELTQRKSLAFGFRLNHETKTLEIIVTGENDAEAEGSLNVDDIHSLMAKLSLLQYALVLSEAGGEQLTPPFNPMRAFEEQRGYTHAKFDTISRSAIGVDHTAVNVSLLVLGGSGRLSGYQMSAETARQVAVALARAAHQTSTRSSRRFDA